MLFCLLRKGRCWCCKVIWNDIRKCFLTSNMSVLGNNMRWAKTFVCRVYLTIPCNMYQPCNCNIMQFPIQMSIVLTHRCNFSCYIFWVESKQRRSWSDHETNIIYLGFLASLIISFHGFPALGQGPLTEDGPAARASMAFTQSSKMDLLHLPCWLKNDLF